MHVEARAHDQRALDRADQRHRFERSRCVVRQVRLQRRVDHKIAGRTEQERSPIWRRLGHCVHANNAASAADILHHDIVAGAEPVEPVRQDARQRIERATRRERNDDADRLGERRCGE